MSNVGSAIARAFGALDRNLESIKLLPVLKEPEEDPEHSSPEWLEVGAGCARWHALNSLTTRPKALYAVDRGTK